MMPAAEQARDLVRNLSFPALFRHGAQDWAARLTPEARRALRAAEDRDDPHLLRRVFLYHLRDEDRLHELMMQFRGVPFARGRRLVRMPSFIVLYFLGTWLRCLHWAVRGGVENARKLENDGPDLENILLALYGRDLISKDKAMLRLYDDLRAIVPVMWSPGEEPAS